ncbi:hypothetical protein IGS74_08740 [Aureimonas sp. OT7]|uniref:hypothetical protein n=1 Tax=Aureimonas TaxID=414371 RepID=UPI0017859DD6|nr:MULTISPECIES: hypothetical protein [Aureimonas]QOG08221.1 hypothetical protein IGS74_08740 [Aureimonas sp. OT7]
MTLSGAEEDTVTFDPQATYSDSCAAAIGHFVDCLRSRAPFETSSNDNLETLQLVEDCYRRSGFQQQRQSAA